MTTREGMSGGRLLDYTLRDSVQRCVSASYFLSVLFALYSVNSIGFIQRFAPEVTLFGNLWPRIVVGSVPLILLGRFMKRGKLSDRGKLFLWIVTFSAILHATAWIHVWPIALGGSSSILTYAQPANVFVAAIVFALVAPPRRYLAPFTSILAAAFYVPVCWIAFRGGDPVVFSSVLNDSLGALLYCVVISTIVDNLRRRIATLEFEKEQEASRFLGPVVSKAIFRGESERLEQVRCRGFVLSIDIRDSTELLRRHGEKWLDFRRDYMKLVSQLSSRHSGYVQKTVGDGHIINFGIMDYGEDLSDIPGIDSELERAEDRRLQRASQSAFTFVEELFSRIHHLSAKAFDGEPVLLGAGLDKGWVERGLQGDGAQNLELDVNGDPVNCASRLQEYSKDLRSALQWKASVLVVSPYASDYLVDFSAFKRFMTAEKPVRNYHGIQWVLVKAVEPSLAAGDASGTSHEGRAAA